MSALLALDTPQPQRLSDMVFVRLADAIVQGELAPGQSLRDQDLADQLGVSRMPVREALQRLERAGLIEMAASRYTRVAELTPQRVRETMEHAGYLYGSIIRLATKRMTDEQAETALALLGKVAASGTDAEAYHEANRAFNDFMIEVCGNSNFRLRSDLLYSVQWVVRQFPFAEYAMVLRAQHERLAGALVDRDADEAERIVREMYGVDGEHAAFFAGLDQTF